MGLIILLAFISFCSGLTFLTPTVQTVHSPVFGRSWPNPQLFYQNFSLRLDPTQFLCNGQTIPSAQLSNAFVMGVYSRCQAAVNGGINGWDQSGASGLLYACPAFNADTYASLFFWTPPLLNPLTTAPGGEPFPNTVNTAFPVFMFRYTGNEDQYTNTEYWPTVVGWFRAGQNVTFNLEQPSWNSLTNAYDQLPMYIAGVVFAGQVIWTMLFILAFVKLTLFVSLEGKIQLSLPQIIISLVIYCCFWEWLQFHWGPWGSRLYLDHRFGIMTVTWGLPAILSASVVLAFYLSEIASLTSAQNVPGLSKFKVPAIIVCAMLWAADFIASSLVASRLPSVNVIVLFEAWAGIELAMSVFAAAFLIWGCITLFRGTANIGDERKAIITRTLLLVIALVVFLLLAAGFFCKYNFNTRKKSLAKTL